MAYEVPPLPYDYDALEPHIDAQTMTLHHDKHHQAYVDKANDALAAGTGSTASRSRRSSRTSATCPRTSAAPSATTVVAT